MLDRVTVTLIGRRKKIFIVDAL